MRGLHHPPPCTPYKYQKISQKWESQANVPSCSAAKFNAADDSNGFDYVAEAIWVVTAVTS